LHSCYVTSRRCSGLLHVGRYIEGYPIYPVECSIRYATCFLSLVVTPVFVTGSNDAPDEWKQVMANTTIPNILTHNNILLIKQLFHKIANVILLLAIWYK